jgi:hypothetical protein
MTHNPAAGDCRRATALVSHHAHGSLPGVNEILRSAVECDRVTPTILATLDFYQAVVPMFITMFGMQALSEVVNSLALDDPDQDRRRAARLIAHHANDNVTEMNLVLQAAATVDRVTQMILGLLDLYEILLPQLHTPLGLRCLEKSVVDLAAAEENDG